MATYIAIEGVIGVGKTTLARYLSRDLGIAPVLESFEDNPFLVGGFYKDPSALAFETQVFFLLQRFRQQKQLSKDLAKLGSGFLVSDYLFEKDRIFARANLNGDDFAVYTRAYEAFRDQIAEPSLVVYLRADLDTIMKRIALRDRQFERDISESYISNLIDGYDRYFAEPKENALIIDADSFDFVHNTGDYDTIKDMIFTGIQKGGEYAHGTQDQRQFHHHGGQHRRGEIHLHDHVCATA